MIDQATRDKILDSANIVDVVSEFVTLRKRGVNYLGLCPFHPEKTPSFSVSPTKNICKCFSCGEGGSPVYFVMKHEQLGYNDALKYLAKKYHIEVHERELTNEEKQLKSARESLFIVNAWAQKHFSSRLFDHEEGRTIGLRYFNERGFREETIRKFQLGYSLDNHDDLYRTALQNGYQAEFLEKTGLVGFYENGATVDRFRGRIIFPVHTVSGQVVAFGGRILRKNDKSSKYINSPESEIYHKSSELYGIFLAKQAIAKADKCFLVEGYTDVISMCQSGVENVVASSGTALTPGQINRIRRITNNITVIYDGDAAGIKAAIRGIDLLLEEGMNVKVVLLPDGEDPDSFARKHNAFEFAVYIQEKETDFIRFKTQLLLNEAGNDPIQKAALITDMIRSIALIPDPIIRSVYIKDCSDLLEVKEQTLLYELNKIRLHKSKETNKISTAVTTAGRDASSPEKVVSAPQSQFSPDLDSAPQSQFSMLNSQLAASPYQPCEEALLRYVIQYGELVLSEYTDENEHVVIRVAEYIHSELQQDDMIFKTPKYREILEESVTLCREPHFKSSRYFLSHADPAVSMIAINLTDDKYIPGFDFRKPVDLSSMPANERVDYTIKIERQMEEFERMIRRDLFSLKIMYVMRQIGDIKKDIRDLQKKGEMDESIKRLNELNRLNEIKKVLSKELGERIILKM
ncbi:MAG: DNA primase [Tannerella sp.]|jgi:DNA primase|nr:DNA primase [Tannerella sp.]